MKMVLAIVQDDDARVLLDELTAKSLRATKLSTSGGFLQTRNCTLLLGVPDEQVATVVGIIRSICRTRMKYVSLMTVAPEGALGYGAQPVEVEVGGAHIFVWSAQRAVLNVVLAAGTPAES
jgi:uncharacterized protein YaaQ